MSYVVSPLSGVIRFGFAPVGSGGTGGGGSPTGTDYRPRYNRLVLGLSHQFIRFGRKPVGSASGGSAVTATFALTDTPDTAAFSVTVAGAVAATFALTDTPDVAAFSAGPGNYFVLTDPQDIASFSVTLPPPTNINPLGKLRMYTGTLGEVSNREDWIVNISFVVEDGSEFDLSTASDIETYITEAGSPRRSILSATLGNGGITLPDHYTMQWMFAESDMQKLCAAQYGIFQRIRVNGFWTQTISGTVAIIEGGPSS